jgi:hypothetical protein
VIAALIAGGALVVLVVAGLAWLNRSDGFPETVGGKPRVHGDLIEKVEKGLESVEIAGMSFDVAFYGTGGEPSIVALLVRGAPDALGSLTSDRFFAAFGPGVTQGLSAGVGAPIEGSAVVTRTIDGIDYLCIALAHPMGASTNGSLCVFRSDTLGLVISTTFSDPRDAVDLAREVAAAA